MMDVVWPIYEAHNVVGRRLLLVWGNSEQKVKGQT
jgi:hypothetical protein